MSLIQCDVDCIYQKDGYCALDMPSAITNYTGNGCVHCIKVIPRAPREGRRPAAPQQPQTPPARS